MADILIFGPGFAAGRLADRLEADGWRVTLVRRTASEGALAFDDEQRVRVAIAAASHVMSSVPPENGEDAVLARYADDLVRAGAGWIGYLSSTGVYGDAGGAWVDETAPLGRGRRTARTAADQAWLTLHPEARVFRLPGIYGPGRSALDRVKKGKAHRIDLPDQVFSRIHVDDLIGGVLASMKQGPAGAYNLADDLPTGQNAVIERACDLLGLPWPTLQTLDEAQLSPMARAFYAENRRVANGKAKRLLGWRLRCPTFREGLRSVFESSS